MFSSLESQHGNQISVSPKASRCATWSKNITKFRLCYICLCILASVTVILHLLTREKKYLRAANDNICLYTHNNNSIPLPLSFSLYYSLNNCSNAFNTFYSSFQCLNGNPSDLHTEDYWHERLCIFHNVCLRKDRSTTNYFIDYFYPSTMEPLRSTIIRHTNSPLVSLRHGSQASPLGGLSVVRMSLIPVNYLDMFDRNRNVVYLNDTYLIYQILADGDMNFGHFIFDDVFGLYSNLKQFRSTRFNLPSKNYVLAHKPCSSFTEPLQNLCNKFTQGIFPVITSHSVRSIDSLFDSSHRVCFRQLVAGQGLAGVVSHSPRNLHRARIFDEFRSDLLNVHGIDPHFTPRQHHIALIKKNGRRKFTNLDEIYMKIQAAPQYTGMKITILENFVDLSVVDQLKLFQTITIAITPCGGISLLFSFLPAKATLIVSGFPFPERTGYSSGRMEAAYWDYQSHLNVLHYPTNSADDFELAVHLKKESSADLRNYADINLKTEKLFPLIDKGIIRASLTY